jgi:TonB family protein
MSAELGRVPEPVGWPGNRNFIVPPDIVPVRRVSPIPCKPRTLCQHRAEGAPVDRAGGREWFADHVFVDFQDRDLRTACGTSFTAHASCLVGLLVLLAGPVATTPERVSSPMRMPAFVAVRSGGSGGLAPQLSVASSAPARKAETQAVARRESTRKPLNPDTASESQVQEPAFEAPAEPDAAAEAADGEATDREATSDSTVSHAGSGSGSGGGDGSGNGGGSGGSGSGAGMSPGPYRVGQGIEPPRKIKHVDPIYPAGALAIRALGTVVVEATVGADGKVHEARIVHSIASLDQAALDAVRQWEFAPSRLNGVPVAVIVTILVQFAIH